MKRLEALVLVAIVLLAWARPVRVLVVRGGSMAPAMTLGDVALVAPGLPVRAGDVACFRDGEGLVCHRVVGYGPEGLRTAGDANQGPDARPAGRDSLVGRVVLVVPSGEPAGRLAGALTMVYHRLRE